MIITDELYKLFFNKALDGMLLADAETHRFYVSNKAMQEMLLYGPEEIKKLRVEDIHSKEDLPYVMKEFEKLLKQEVSVNRDIPVKRKDGTIFYADISAFLATYAERKCLFGVFRDVTDLRQAQKTLALERDRTRKFLDVVDALIVVIAADESISLINKTGREILGYTDSEVVGKNWFDKCIPARERKEVKTEFAKLIKGDTKAPEFYTNHVLNKTGEEKVIAWHNLALKDEKGRNYAMASYGQDITNRIDLVEIRNEMDVTRARVRVRVLAEALGFNYMEQERIASAVLELVKNAFEYAGGGIVKMQPVEKEGRGGIEIIVEDHGPGIRNLELALKPGHSTSGHLGEGLSTCRRLMDEFDIKSQVGEGTLVTVRKWL
jgi:PAS domain S-box-containing protein